MHEHLRAASVQEQSQSLHVSSAISYNDAYKCCYHLCDRVPLLAQFLEPSREPGKLEILDAPNKVSVRETIVKLQVSR